MKLPTLFSPVPGRSRSRAFTLIELLTVISIIAIMAAFLVPAATAALRAARNNKTLVKLHDIIDMSTLYHNQYKVWPTLQTTPPAGQEDYALQLKDDTGTFVRVMTGKVVTQDEMKLNLLQIPFGSFSTSDLDAQTSTKFVDAYGNNDIIIWFDTDGNGNISAKAITSHAVTSMDGKNLSVDQTVDVKNPVIIMTPGAGVTNNDVITSWDVR